jgi:hypothetical protein
VVECGALEMRFGGNVNGGSNPPLSVNFSDFTPFPVEDYLSSSLVSYAYVNRRTEVEKCQSSAAIP